MTPTLQLRWLTTTIAMCDGPGNDVILQRLQQCWIDELGQDVWKDVPDVVVSNDAFRDMPT